MAVNAIVQFGLLAMEIVPHVIAGVSGAAQAFSEAHAVYKALAAEGRDPTPAEWDALNAGIKALEDKLHSDEH